MGHPQTSEDLAKLAYEEFCKTFPNQLVLSWEELPSSARLAWVASVKVIVLNCKPASRYKEYTEILRRLDELAGRIGGGDKGV